MPVIIREALPGDAGKLIKYITRLLEEPNSFLEMSEGEFKLTEKEEMQFLDDCNKSKNSIFLIAEEDGRIIGNLICKGSDREKIKHNVVLGMSVDKNYRNTGIGSRLMEQAIKWAKNTGLVKRIELYVFTTNARAIHLYMKYGFKIEGEKQKALKVNDEYVNEYVMALLI